MIIDMKNNLVDIPVTSDELVTDSVQMTSHLCCIWSLNSKISHKHIDIIITQLKY